MQPKEALRVKCDEYASAATKLGELQKRAQGFVAEREAAKSALDAADAALMKQMSSELLDGADPKATAAAKQSRSDADDKSRATEAAAKTLGSRIGEATDAVERLNRERLEAAALVARELADGLLVEIRAAATTLAGSLERWHRLEALSRKNEGFTSGDRMRESLGIDPILKEYQIRGDLAPTHSGLRLMQPEELL